MTLEFLKEAEEEFFRAALWYEARRPGLGKRFRDEIRQVERRIAQSPLRWSERPGGYRRELPGLPVLRFILHPRR